MSKIKAKSVTVQIGDGTTYAAPTGEQSVSVKFSAVLDEDKVKADNDLAKEVKWIEVSGNVTGKTSTSIGDLQDMVTTGKISSGSTETDIHLKIACGSTTLATCAKVLLSDFQVSAPVDGQVTYSFSFKGYAPVSNS